MPNRYTVATIDDKRYGIWDYRLDGFCTLAVKPEDSPEDYAPSLLPLEWDNPISAQSWLQRCYTAWARGLVPAPDNWSPYLFGRRENAWDSYRSHPH